jgi:tetratricopeptide (TPR) repeat protein
VQRKPFKPFEKYNQGSLLVELGYNLQLQKKEDDAKIYYDQAIGRLKKNPNEVYGIASSFEKKVLLDYALKSYQIASDLEPKYNFNYQKGLLYGQLGNTEMMISTFLDESYANPQNSIVIQNQLSRFMSDDSDANFNETLRKDLILRVQKNQDLLESLFELVLRPTKEFSKSLFRKSHL